MPVAKPAVLPRWATGGSALIAEPSEAKKDAGWIAEEPPANWWNWLQLKIYNWLQYVNDPEQVTVDSSINGPAIYGKNSGSHSGVKGETSSNVTDTAGVNALSTGAAPALKAVAGSGRAIDATGDTLLTGALQVTGAITVPAPSPTLISSLGFGANWAEGGDSSHASARYWKNHLGDVVLEGSVVATGTSPAAIAFTLPAGFRPPGLSASQYLIFPVFREALTGFTGVVAVNGSGQVLVDRLSSGDAAIASGHRFHLNGVRFRTA